MARYIVTHDPSDPGQNYAALIGCNKLYRNHKHIMQSTWGVATARTAKEVRDYLKPALDSNDKLLVGSWVPPSAGEGLPADVIKWIDDDA